METQPLNWLLVGEWLIAFGILAVAAAAVWSLLQTRRAMLADATPNLLLEGVALEPLEGDSERTALRATAVNLGRHPIYLLELTIDTDALTRPKRTALRKLIPASEVTDLNVVLPRLTAVEDGELRISFHYGPTGAIVHRSAVGLVAADGGLIGEPPGERSGLDLLTDPRAPARSNPAP